MPKILDDDDFLPIAIRRSHPKCANPPGLLGVVIGGIGVWIWWATGSWLGLLGVASLGLGWLVCVICRERPHRGSVGFVLGAAVIPVGAVVGHLVTGMDGEMLGVAGLILGYPALVGAGLS